MTKLDRRKMLHAGIAFAAPLGSVALLSKYSSALENQEKDNAATSDGKTADDEKAKSIQIQYLEVVTTDVDGLCKQYSAIHGVTFGKPIPEFGNARTATLSGGGRIGVRAPMRETETPVVRPYTLVEDIDAALAAATKAGAEIAMGATPIPGQGEFAIVIQGGIHCGMWQV